MVTANTIALTIFFIVPTSVVVSFPLQTSSVVSVIPALGDFKEIGGRARRPDDGTKVTIYAQRRSAEDYESASLSWTATFLEEALTIAKFEPGISEIGAHILAH